jgi:SAM-dependent methyltransferase
MAEETLDANAAMRRYWNTVAGPRWVASPGFRERRNQESLGLLLAHLSLAGGESVLEIGCGTGALTLPLAAAVGEHGRVVAVDISEPMLGAARQKVGERGLRNVTLHSGDAQVFAFEPAVFDVATSRMGVMFFADPAAAFGNIKGAEAGRPARLRLLGADCGEPSLVDLLRRGTATSGAADAYRARARPARFWRPRLYREGSDDSRVRRDRSRTRPPDDHWRQPRGRSPPSRNDGPDSTTDRSQKPR